MNQQPFNLTSALSNAKGQKVLCYDTNNIFHYGNIVVAQFSPIAHLIIQTKKDEQRILMIQNLTSIIINPTTIPEKLMPKPEPEVTTTHQRMTGYAGPADRFNRQ